MLNLGYERAMQLANPVPVIGPGLSYEATKAINSVLYQRLQDQIGDDTTSQKINEERIRDINITNLASSNNINKSDLVAILQSGMLRGEKGDRGDRGERVIWENRDLPERTLLLHNHLGVLLDAQEALLPWKFLQNNRQ